MDTNFSHINPSFIEHEGFYYLEFEGAFSKGCTRCGGEGHFSHNGEHSRCYECDNTSAKLGEQLENRAAAEKWCHERALRRAQRERAAEAKRMVKVNMMLSYQKSLQDAATDVYDYLMAVELDDFSYDEAGNIVSENAAEKNPFIRSMAETLRYVGNARLFSTNMIEAVRKIMVRDIEQAAESAAHPAPTGRVVVTGEITSTKMVESDYGTAYKILVKDDAGYKVWVSLPKAQADQAIEAFHTAHGTDAIGYSVWFTGSENEPERFTGIKGDRITFTATLEPSHNDVAFAFGSRPTKGAWL